MVKNPVSSFWDTSTSQSTPTPNHLVGKSGFDRRQVWSLPNTPIPFRTWPPLIPVGVKNANSQVIHSGHLACSRTGLFSCCQSTRWSGPIWQLCIQGVPGLECRPACFLSPGFPAMNSTLQVAPCSPLPDWAWLMLRPFSHFTMLRVHLTYKVENRAFKSLSSPLKPQGTSLPLG